MPGRAPRVPAELVTDHSVVADYSGRPDAFSRNIDLEFARNEERYRFLRWGQQALGPLAVVSPDTEICHRVNLEHLARVVFATEHLCAPAALLRRHAGATTGVDRRPRRPRPRQAGRLGDDRPHFACR